MTEEEIKDMIYKTGEELLNYAHDFCLIIQTDSGYTCYAKHNAGSVAAYYTDISNFRAEDFTFNDGTKAISFISKPASKTKKFNSYREIISGNVKSSDGVCSLTINDGICDWEVGFCEGTDEYLRTKIKVGDYLKLNVIVLVLFSQKKEYILCDTADILEHRRTVTLKG